MIETVTLKVSVVIRFNTKLGLNRANEPTCNEIKIGLKFYCNSVNVKKTLPLC